LALQGPAGRDVPGPTERRGARDALHRTWLIWNWQRLSAGCPARLYPARTGFEISCQADQANDLARVLLPDDRVEAIGLGRTGSLAAGRPGFGVFTGHDIDSGHLTDRGPGLLGDLRGAPLWKVAREGGFSRCGRILTETAQGCSARACRPALPEGVPRCGKVWCFSPPLRGGDAIGPRDIRRVRTNPWRACCHGHGCKSDHAAAATPLYGEVRASGCRFRCGAGPLRLRNFKNVKQRHQRQPKGTER